MDYPDGSDDVAIVPASATEDITEMGGFGGTVGLYIQLGSYGLAFSDYNSCSFQLAVFSTSSSVLNSNTIISGACVFNGSAISYGYISGDCMFSGNGSGNSGNVYGDCLFPNSSSNYNYITGNAHFTDSSYNSGSIYGTATFNGTNSYSASNSGYIQGLELKLPEGYNYPGYTVRPLDILGAGI